MKAVLLAAGLGMRLRPLTEHTPKCMMQIAGKPLLGIWIDLLIDNAVDAILINTHYLPDAVRRYVAVHRARERIELFHEPQLLGTAGTLRALSTHLCEDSFFVAHADNLARFSFARFRAAHEARPAGIHLSLLAFQSDDPRACGILEVDGQGVVTAFHEKVSNPPGRLANAAIYFMDSSVLQHIRGDASQPTDLSTQVLPRYVGAMQAWSAPDTYVRDIGNPQALRLANAEWKKLRSQPDLESIV